MSKTAITSAPIAPVLADRWSPRSYDETHELSNHDLLSILEAGRWAPSANNVQPWRFSVGRRGEAVFAAIAENLTSWNAAWAPTASALLLVSGVVKNEAGEENRWAHFDSGLATANILTQVTELGLHAHVMAGVEFAPLAAALGHGDHLKGLVAIAIGKVAPAEKLQGPLYDRELAPRVRLPLDEIVIDGNI
jgi:nitroreductase